MKCPRCGSGLTIDFTLADELVLVCKRYCGFHRLLDLTGPIMRRIEATLDGLPQEMLDDVQVTDWRQYKIAIGN